MNWRIKFAIANCHIPCILTYSGFVDNSERLLIRNCKKKQRILYFLKESRFLRITHRTKDFRQDTSGRQRLANIS